MEIYKPLVSVIMTAFNREKYIAEAIQSVLISTYKNFELIIVDDCSTDNTVEIANEYYSIDKRIKIYINQNNMGQWPNRNKAAEYVSGDLIMWVDSDDKIQPDAIEYVVKQFTKFPNVFFSMIYHKNDIKEPTVLSSKVSVHNHFFKEGFLNIGPGGTVVKPGFFKLIKGYSEKYGPIGDMYFNLKVAANTDILLLPYNYLIYRRHNGQEINNEYSYLCDGFRYISDAMQLPELPLTEEEKRRVLKQSARQNLISIIRYLKKSGSVTKSYKAFKLSGIKLNQLL